MQLSRLVKSCAGLRGTCNQCRRVLSSVMLIECTSLTSSRAPATRVRTRVLLCKLVLVLLHKSYGALPNPGRGKYRGCRIPRSSSGASLGALESGSAVVPFCKPRLRRVRLNIPGGDQHSWAPLSDVIPQQYYTTAIRERHTDSRDSSFSQAPKQIIMFLDPVLTDHSPDLPRGGATLSGPSRCRCVSEAS